MDADADRPEGLDEVESGLKLSALQPASAIKGVSAGSDKKRIKRLEMALDAMSQGLCMFNARSRLLVCNRRYQEIFGLEPGVAQPGMTQEELCLILLTRGCYPPEVTLEDIRAGTQAALRNPCGTPIFRPLADGRMLAVFYRPIEGGGWVSTFEDITERRHSEARLAYLSRHDTLTDLVNARSLRNDSQALLSPGPRTPVLAVHYLGLDRFKAINDTYGHDAGDELLCAVAERLRSVAGRGIRIGRTGGDEFAILQRTASRDSALALAKRVSEAIGAPYHLSHGRVLLSVSIGLAVRTGAVDDLEPLLREADLALRQAKMAGRGTVSLFDPTLSETARERRTLEAELHRALVEEEFEVHYQSLVDINGHRIVGVEALVRWRHSERGMVSPGTFIPLAEEIGLIVPLGAWVLRRACQEAVDWPAHVGVAVNVSSMQMRHKGFAADVLEILAETGFPAARLEIEITESALLDQSEIIMQNLHALRAAGIRFAMDDFGTGYSSLSYLRRFPFDKIKIDASFMKDAETSADALAIIRAVAGLGASLGITTLIEGVETAAQLDLARAEGVQQAQGYLLSRPQPAASIVGLLRAEPPPRDDGAAVQGRGARPWSQ